MAVEVLSNIDAMSAAIGEVGPGDPISVATLLTFHQRLLGNTRQAQLAGRLREKQNWIGGSDYNPCAATFVPPPPELVPELMEDLCAFCTGETLPAVAQAAIAHAQFETIHPFADGNGRTGRALIQLVLRRRGLATRVLAAALIGRSYPQANAAIERLVSAGLLSQITVGRRNRAFEAPAIVNAFTDLERQLASPDGETRTSDPVRPVPPEGQHLIKVCATSLNKANPC